ncbi:hypothetical protein CONPUDRAFT_19529, partial [Coniophora puteana RWD-64-598 SS2]
VHTMPSKELGGRKGMVAAPWDNVLVVVDSVAYQELGGFAGLCITELHIIFNLPPHHGNIREPLVYVHWYYKLNINVVEPNSSMFKVSMSTR